MVHAVFFYSPTCPHCHQVINEFLIPMQSRYGSRLVVLAFDVTQGFANNFYMGMLRHFGIPQEDWVVPILVAADQVMIGGIEIPARFTPMVEEGLASGGIDLPELPDLLLFLGQQDMLETRFPGRRMTRLPPDLAREEPAPTADSAAAEVAHAPDSAVAARDTTGSLPVPTATPAAAGDTAAPPPERPSPGATPPSPTSGGAPDSSPPVFGDEPPGTPLPPAPAAGGTPASGRETALGLAQAARVMESVTMGDRFRQDPRGNSLSVAVLLLMVGSLVWTGYPPRARARRWPAWLVPALVVVGFGVASYLSFVEVTHAEAVCGPVGDCNTVNQSEWARLFGVLPVGVLGLAGYVVILILWLLARSGPEGARAPAALGLWGAVLFGTLFSAYLTFLEPFVIGATCAWCLTSALVMTLLLWAVAPMAGEVWPAREPASPTGGEGDA